MKKSDVAGYSRPRLVVIGGGTGLAVMLRGLKELPVDITAIVTVADDGGSSGRLRSDLQMPPPGDVRNVLIALADTEPLLEKVFQYRFENGDGLAGHNLGNLMIAALKDITGDFNHAIQEMSRVLAVRGRVLPASENEVVLSAEMCDGTIVQGESSIPKSGKRIRRVFLQTPEPKALDEALAAIAEADGIVLGPGSLYTSILPNLLVKGMADAVRASAALKIYVCNVMTQPGETDGYTAADHVEAVHRHIGPRFFDAVIVNNELPTPTVQQKYAEEGAEPVLPDIERLRRYGCEVVAANLLQFRTVLRHDAAKLSRLIVQLVQGRKRRRQSG
ncbi:gluconeogenesis factor [Marinithermofilum abyssi]|uniref:Gluconeogenesis factor n=1 Tax=Marinithermofilum abyssi TaxID=1571185 RepID=A0A8J2VF24_9BACL|nr:YvcK family protein [Marinithermofilum abyssi]GGE04203.1 gluconeogenesis factor [Marinithermofilum abyssi]